MGELGNEKSTIENRSKKPRRAIPRNNTGGFRLKQENVYEKTGFKTLRGNTL